MLLFLVFGGNDTYADMSIYTVASDEPYEYVPYEMPENALVPVGLSQGAFIKQGDLYIRNKGYYAQSSDKSNKYISIEEDQIVADDLEKQMKKHMRK